MKNLFITILFKITPLLFCWTFFSCAATPPAPAGFEPPAESAVTVDESGIADASGGAAGEGPADEIPGVDLPPGEEEPDEAAEELDEPFVDLPETAEALAPPPESPLPDLPEPPIPGGIREDPAPPPPEPPPPEPPPSQTPPPAPPAPEPPPPETPPPVPPAPEPPPPAPPAPAPESSREPPVPPPFLRPPEEAVPPREREPVPAPVNPVPDPPARTPPPAVREEELVFSRILRATAGQLAEIPFRGSGWVFLGELSSRRGLAYDSRRLDPEGQSFIFRCETPGIYVLKFYKQDFIRDYILNDYVQVIVGEAPEHAGIGLFNAPVDRGRVVAEPRWPPLDSEREALSRTPGVSPGSRTEAAGTEEAPAARTPPPAADGAAGALPPPPETTAGIVPLPESGGNEGSPAEGTPVLPDQGLPETYLEKAREEFEAGRVAGAIALVDQFRERFPQGSDEAWWLYGRFYEANSPARDIRLAADYYRRLVREFPQSRRVPEAQRRIAYLERFYFNIQ